MAMKRDTEVYSERNKETATVVKKYIETRAVLSRKLETVKRAETDAVIVM